MTGRKVLFELMTLSSLTMSVSVSADTYRLLLMDISTSMRDNEYSPGVSRLDEAKNQATQRFTSKVGNHDALWLLAGSDSGPVEINGLTWGETRAVYDGTNFVDEDFAEQIRREVNRLTATGTTPLAEEICKAVEALETVSAGDTNPRLEMFVFTDAEENASTLEDYCADPLYENYNLYPFEFLPDFDDDLDTWTDSVPVGYRMWIEPGTFLMGNGRAYWDGDSSIVRDWAGSVNLHSWEWNVYHRTVVGFIPQKPANPNDYNNRIWTPDATEVIQNYHSFFTYVTTVDGAMLMADAPAKTVSAAEEESDDSAAFYPVTDGIATAKAEYAVASISPQEESLFAGLAFLSGGEYVPHPSGQIIKNVADLDGDGDVDEQDLRFVLTWFGRPVDEYNQASFDADLYRDGFIDNADIQVVRQNWNDNDKYPPIIGDADYNWCIDDGDLSKVWPWFDRIPESEDQAFYHADINVDGTVDLDDALIIWNNWGRGCDSYGIPY